MLNALESIIETLHYMKDAWLVWRVVLSSQFTHTHCFCFAMKKLNTRHTVGTGLCQAVNEISSQFTAVRIISI